MLLVTCVELSCQAVQGRLLQIPHPGVYVLRLALVACISCYRSALTVSTALYSLNTLTCNVPSCETQLGTILPHLHQQQAICLLTMTPTPTMTAVRADARSADPPPAPHVEDEQANSADTHSARPPNKQLPQTLALEKNEERKLGRLSLTRPHLLPCHPH